MPGSTDAQNRPWKFVVRQSSMSDPYLQLCIK